MKHQEAVVLYNTLYKDDVIWKNGLHCCKHCEYSSKLARCTTWHIFFHHKKLWLDCCDTKFTNIRTYGIHYKNKHAPIPKRAPKINIINKAIYNEISSLITRTGEHPNVFFTCNQCEFRKSKQSKIVHHIYFKHMNNKIQCPNCPNKYSQYWSYIRHRNQTHLVPQIPSTVITIPT